MSRVAEGRLRREKEWEEAPSTGLPVGTGWGRAGSGGPGEFTPHCCGCHTPAPRLSREPAATGALPGGCRLGDSRERRARGIHPTLLWVSYTCPSSLQGACSEARSPLPPSARDAPLCHLHTNTQQFQPFQRGASAGDLSVLCFFKKKITYLYLAASGLSCGVTDLHFGTRAYLPRDMWDLSSSTRDRTWVPCLGKWILNHWTTREVPLCGLLSMSLCEMLPSTSAHILLAVWISFVNGLLGNLCQFALGLPVLFLLIFMYSG